MESRTRLDTTLERVRGVLAIIAALLVIVVAAMWIAREVVAWRGPTPVVAANADAVAPSAPDGVRPPPPPPVPLPTEPLSLAGAAIKGSRDAQVAIIAFSDFHCPYCQRFAHETLPELEAKYIAPGRVMFAWRHLALEQIHPQAVRAAEAAECAGEQNRFWEMHDRIFERPDAHDDGALRGHASAMQLDARRFDACLDRGVAAKIRAEGASASRYGITGTPGFLIGTVVDGRVLVADRVRGAQSARAFERILDRMLAGSVPAPGR